jgi:hypothetical protein
VLESRSKSRLSTVVEEVRNYTGEGPQPSALNAANGDMEWNTLNSTLYINTIFYQNIDCDENSISYAEMLSDKINILNQLI